MIDWDEWDETAHRGADLWTFFLTCIALVMLWVHRTTTRIDGE